MKAVTTLVALCALCLPAAAQVGGFNPDSVKVRYVWSQLDSDDFTYNHSKHIILVNEEVTTHVVMPENIKLVDISTDKLVGNQCADNIVRIKPSGRMRNNEMVGTITVIGERHMAQYDVVYTSGPVKACSVYNISIDELKQYKNPDVLMPERSMADYAYAIFCSQKNYNNIHSSKYGIKAVVNNIYTVNDYFFIDFSLYNKTKIKYDIAELRIKLTNVIVVNKLTFPNEKILRLEISENQISGRVVYIPFEYEDILNADSFDENLLKRLPYNIRRP